MDHGIKRTMLIQIAVVTFLLTVENTFATNAESLGTVCVSDREIWEKCNNQEDCNQYTTLHCFNGECSEDGRCICLPCWQGRSCNISANANPPVVNYGENIEVSVPADQPAYEVFLHVETTDADKDHRCAEVACPCVDTIFSLQQDDVDEDIFDVKSSNSKGAMFVKKAGKLEVGRVYDVIMAVHNADGQQRTEISVKVRTTQPLGFDDAHDEDAVLSRSRRAAASPLDVNDTLRFTLDVLSPTSTNVTNITAGTHVDVQLTIGIPPAVQIDSMSFEFFAENNVSSFGVVCEPGVKDFGSSIIYEEANPGLDFNSENYFQAETSYLTLTNITNTDSVTEDQLSLEFGVTILNDDDVKFGELNWISIGAEFLDFSRIWVGQVGFYIAPKEAVVVASPRLDTNGTSSINKGESGVISLLMNVYEHSYNLSVAASVASTSGYHICKFGLRTTGKGYCLENADPVQSFTVDSITGYNTEAFFDFKEVIYSGENNNDEDSLIVMDLFIQLPDDVSIVSESYTVTFDVTIDGVLSTVSTDFVGADGVTPNESPVTPSFDLNFPELTDGFPYTLNELIELDLTFTFPVGVYGDVTVDFQIQGQSIEIPVYSLDVVKIGYNIGCFETCTTFKQRDVCPPYANLVELLNIITNRGLRFWANDDDDVILRAMLRLGDVPLGNQTITATLAVDAADVAEATLVVDIMQRSPLTPVLPRIFASIPDELTILVTETGSHVINIVLEPDTEFFYTLEFNSNVDWLIVKNVTTVAMGNDIEGDLNDLIPVTDFSTGNYTATIELGFINNIALFPNETTDEDSTISLEVIIGFNDIALSIENGAEAMVNVAIVVSDAAPTPTIDQSLLSLTVTAINETIYNITSKFTLDCPSEASAIQPGQVVSCTVVMNFTDYREFVVFDVETSPNTTDTIGLIILSVEVISFGGNLQVSDSPSDTLESSQNNSQMDRGTIDFGSLTNTGISSDPADDQVIIEIQVQATDAEENVNGTQLLLGTGASVSDKLVWVAYTTLYVNRDGSETPQLNCSFGLEDGAVDELFNLGNLITYAVTIQHDRGSSFAEALNVSATFFLPPYFYYESTSAILDHTATTSGKKLIISIPRLYFNDIFNFTVLLSRDCGYTFNFKNEWKATTLLEITYHTHHRDADGVVDGADPLSSVIKDPIKSVSFDFNVSQELVSNEGTSPVCLSPTALGMESGDISNCQISSSHENDPTGAAADARRNGVSGWKVGKSGPFAGHRWLKVDIGRLSAVTMIQTQGGKGASFEGDIGEYEVFYSKDDVVYRRAFHMNGSDADPVFNHRKGYPSTPPTDYYDLYSAYFFHRPVEARFVIIRLLEDNAADVRLFNVLRFELYGCFLEAQQLDVCENRTEKEINKLPEEYDRGFVVDTDTSTLYVCSPTIDNQPGLSEGISDDTTYLFRRGKRTTRCFKTTDTYTWQGLSDNIHVVIGYSPVTGGVYGIAGYVSPVYVVSFDGGVEWSEITNDQFADASAAVQYVSYNELPLESTDSFNYLDGDNTFITTGSFEATFNGFKGQRGGSQQKIFDWNTCCQN